MGKLLAGGTILIALLGGAFLYYQQVYAYYEEVVATGVDDVVLVPYGAQEPEPVLYNSFQAIDANSSPIRYRACFNVENSVSMLTETYEGYEAAEPRIAPSWFGCFDAVEIGEALERGEALAFLSQANEPYGIDRVIAVFPDGRGYAWHQINPCGEAHFDGTPVPEDCPPAPSNAPAPVEN